MVFKTPSWVPQLPFDPPDDVTIAEFMSNPKYGRYPINRSKNPFTCSETGTTYGASEVAKREDCLARGLRKRLTPEELEGSEWNRVVTFFSYNSIDYVPATHAVHRLSGIVAAASAEYSAAELEYQLRQSGCKTIFTCAPLLPRALEAAAAVGIPNNRIFILSLPHFSSKITGHESIDDLIVAGQDEPPLEPVVWPVGQGERQVAYLCYSSGTSGFPKGVKISHRNVIANVLQLATYESITRRKEKITTQVTLGLLPFNHIYGLVLLGHLAPYRGDEVIVQTQHNLTKLLTAIQRFRIEKISVVPPILVQILASQDQCKAFDLSSIRHVHTGAAPLGRETSMELLKIYPDWKIIQGYGMTETAAVVAITDDSDIRHGSCGSLLPGAKAKIVDSNGKEVHEHDTPGELLVQSPSVVLGYLNNELATGETFVHQADGRWIRTGDEVVIRKSSAGHEHLVVVDRIKELIKVKGHQVAPAELEACILSHPAVSDCAVIGVKSERAGEVPRAVVVRTPDSLSIPEEKLVLEICKYVENNKARYKWLKGGIKFVDAIPKSPSGKILRRLVRDQENQAIQRSAKL
ncbi:hypothetical protein NM208_g9473 [Fusarium decemcellulare]|uniref:Uncharacterized protein n=1 Tax=Fusarium decemcellulare TaxID=57161 RepID=A0ACC1S1F6_9HYPO|nr:hypothetical protein NM208_g9473 [Fusarium decemcellulare]